MLTISPLNSQSELSGEGVITWKYRYNYFNCNYIKDNINFDCYASTPPATRNASDRGGGNFFM